MQKGRALCRAGVPSGPVGVSFPLTKKMIMVKIFLGQSKKPSKGQLLEFKPKPIARYLRCYGEMVSSANTGAILRKKWRVEIAN